nr:hypothetical protein [uncultured bacterium]
MAGPFALHVIHARTVNTTCYLESSGLIAVESVILVTPVSMVNWIQAKMGLIAEDLQASPVVSCAMMVC